MVWAGVGWGWGGARTIALCHGSVMGTRPGPVQGRAAFHRPHDSPQGLASLLSAFHQPRASSHPLRSRRMAAPSTVHDPRTRSLPPPRTALPCRTPAPQLIAAGKQAELLDRVYGVYVSYREGHDLVLVEGPGPLMGGTELDAQVGWVGGCTWGLRWLDASLVR